MESSVNMQDAPRYQGKLMSTVDGGYPVIYYSADGSEWCVDCANQEDAEPEVTAFDVYYEGPPVYCSGCGVEIESACGDPDAEDGDES
jgi:hypothetical protein